METYSAYKQLSRYREINEKVRVALYSRCSSDEQKKNGYTIKDQLDYGYIFAKENDLLVVGEYVDEGVSATLEIHKRKALSELLEDAKEGKFDIIVIKCLDRFFRNVEEFYTAQKILRKAGVTWVSIEESDLDPDDTDASFKINIYLAMAEYEARKTAKRIRFNNKMRIHNKQVVTGQQCFHFPWKVVGEPRNKHLERNMEKADMLYDLLNHFEIHQSKSKTTAYINIKYGVDITLKTIGFLLSDTLLYGEYKGVAGYVEPFITKERFDNIQEILKRNSVYSPKREKIYIFSGIINCRCCGNKLVGCSNTSKYKVQSYRCNKRHLEGTCENNQSISEKKIEKQLLNNLERYIENEIVRIESIQEKKNPVVDNTKKIEAIKKEMERLNKMYRKGRMEEEEYDEEYAILEKDLKILTNTEEEKPRNLDGLKMLLESDFRTIYNALDQEHKKAFWKRTIKEFTIDENKKIVEGSIIFF